jgi:hypothetical protein
VFALCAVHAGCNSSHATAGSPGTSASHHVAPDGDDAGPGTDSQPWRTIARATRDLVAGDTLELRGGTYFERDLQLDLAGTAARPITLRGRDGEVAVVDGGFGQFRSAGNDDWLPYDAGRGIYRSRDAFPDANVVYGVLGAGSDGDLLVPYTDYGALSSDLEDYSESAPFYVGPGVCWNSSDAHVYVRLQPSRYHARLGLPPPASGDPRQVPMVLFADGAVLQLASTAAFLVFEGLVVRHGSTVVDVASGSHDLTLLRCELFGGRYGVVTRDGMHDLLIDGLVVNGRFPAWLARSDVKRPSAGPPAHLLQGSALQLEGGIDRVVIRNCHVTGLFDAIDTNGTPTAFDVHDNAFDTIRDDVFEVATAGHHFDFHHNTIRRATAAVSWAGSVPPPAGAAGTKYVHHNVIDTSTPQLYGRDDPQHLLAAAWRGPAGDGMATGVPFATHDTASLSGTDPWKIYHNTIVGAADVDGDGLGVSYRFAPFDASVPHEVCNNILVQTGDQWLVNDARVDDGSQVFDGNLYYRSFASPTQPLLQSYRSSSGSASFQRLSDFLASALWQATRSYGPGWETAGVEGDPQLDVDWRPAASGPAASGALDLSGRGWPGVASVAWRGALPPR